MLPFLHELYNIICSLQVGKIDWYARCSVVGRCFNRIGKHFHLFLTRYNKILRDTWSCHTNTSFISVAYLFLFILLQLYFMMLPWLLQQYFQIFNLTSYQFSLTKVYLKDLRVRFLKVTVKKHQHLARKANVFFAWRA